MANPLSIANLRMAFANRLLKKPDAQSIPSFWDSIIFSALDEGYAIVQERLQIRGYTQAQIDAWPRCEDFVRRLALCQIYNEGQGLHAFDDKITSKAFCDAEKALDSVMVIDTNYQVVTPNPAGISTSGSLTWNEQKFRPSTSYDPKPESWSTDDNGLGSGNAGQLGSGPLY